MGQDTIAIFFPDRGKPVGCHDGDPCLQKGRIGICWPEVLQAGSMNVCRSPHNQGICSCLDSNPIGADIEMATSIGRVISSNRPRDCKFVRLVLKMGRSTK